MRIEGTPESPKPSGNLRGLEKFTKPFEKIAEDVGETALEPVTADPKGVLRGLEKFPSATEETGPISHELAIGAKIIQRDSGTVHEIDNIQEVKHGKVVNLVVKDKEGKLIRKVTLGYDDLKTKLETEGSAWHW